jgi:N-methylhydantoinase A
MASYRLGIDIGGTFTDFVLLNETDSSLYFGKTLTTYPDPSDGIITGTKEVLATYNVPASEVHTIVHGTTLVTNAVIERKGAKTGLITTKGFEDVLEIGRELRYDIYDIFLTMPEPLVPPELRVGVFERMGPKGEVIEVLNKSHIVPAIERLQKEGVRSVGVCFLHSFMNPAHEQAVGWILKERFPQMYFSLSSEVMPEIREYERASATVMNAYVQPITDDYLQKLRRRLKEECGFQGVINIMISSGRLTTVDGARKMPIQLLESGPAGGTMAGVFFGKLTNRTDLLAFDMGGTTAKASMILDSKPEITNQFEAARVRRFKKGSGLPVRIPVIDMIEIGAGGGSIAHIDHLGLLKVGPESAASQPGPACYGRGGTKPTVTDADVVLGYLNEDYFLGGTMKLDVEAAHRAISTHIAEPLGISIDEAALGLKRVVDENMAGAARVHILEKGYDPRRFSMMAFGGAGPVHAYNVARLLMSPQLIIPVGAGVTSALGFLVSPVASEAIRSYVCPLDAMDWAKVNALMHEMEHEGFEFLRQAGVRPEDGSVSRVADMRYVGQGHEITVSIPNGELTSASVADIAERFTKEYEFRYNRSITDVRMETVTWRVVVSAKAPHITPNQQMNQGGGGALKGHRAVWFPAEQGRATVLAETPVYSRYLLNAGDTFEGPAIIEEMESTTVVGLASRVSIDEHRNIVIDMQYK